MKRGVHPGEALLRISMEKDREYPEGEICGILFPEKIHYKGCTDLIMKIDRIYDLLEYQIPSEKIRHYGEAEQKRWSQSELSCLERRETFNPFCMPMEPAKAGTSVLYLNTLYRKNTSWQGFLRLMGQKEKKEIPFRSVLELIHLLEDYWMEISEKPAV